MAYLSDIVRIELVFPDATYTVGVANSRLKFKKVDNDEYGFTVRQLSEITFYNDSNNIFDKLYDEFEVKQLCTQVLMKLYTIDMAGTVTLRQTYELPVRAGNWDKDKCRVTMTPRLLHKYAALLDIAGDDKNLLSGQDRNELNFVDAGAVIEIKTCTDNDSIGTFVAYQMPEAACYPNMVADGWTVIKNVVDLVQRTTGYYATVDFEYTPFIMNGHITTTYARAFVAGVTEPSSGGWSSVSGGWAKPVQVTYEGATVVESQAYNGIAVPDPQDKKYTVTREWKTAGIDIGGTDQAQQIDNGVLLNDILAGFADDAGLTIQSDFFGINPDGTAPANKAYDYADAYLKEMLVFQASDIIRASVETNAVRLSMNFEKLYTNLKKLNIAFVDAPDGVLRIEHVSYKRQKQHFDLLGTYEDIKGGAEYDYMSEKIPRYERFYDKYTTNSVDFDGAYIKYDALCRENTETKYTSPDAVYNIGYLFDNPEIAEDLDKQKDTIVIASMVGGVIASSKGAISGKTILNGPLAWSNVIANLWLWDRPQKTGKINNRSTIEFESVKPVRKQKPLKVYVCAKDYFDDFSEEGLVRAHFGWQGVEGAEYTLPSTLLELDLKF